MTWLRIRDWTIREDQIMSVFDAPTADGGVQPMLQLELAGGVTISLRGEERAAFLAHMESWNVRAVARGDASSRT